MAVIATGFFDGVHLGHRCVIDTLLREARRRSEEAVIITFWPHPRTVLQSDARNFRLLTSLEEKKALLMEMGVDRVEVIPFTKEFSSMTASQYVRHLQESSGASCLVLGYDTRFGSDQKGPEEIASLDILPCIIAPAVESAGGSVPPMPSASPTPPQAVPPLTLPRSRGCSQQAYEMLAARAEGPGPAGMARASGAHYRQPSFSTAGAVSSTLIRKALEGGDVQSANAMLGRAYTLHGVVISGNQLGRTLGFPTANMQLYDPLKLVPGRGVYLVEVETLGRRFHGMTNIGVRPTVGNGSNVTIETNIFDFDEMIYGLDIKLSFILKIRDERRFSSLDELSTQLAEDRDDCLSRL